MEKINNITQIAKILPHGSATEIAKRAKVHRNTVDLFLRGKSKNHKVLLAVSEYIIELKEREKSLYRAFVEYCEESSK
jgi:hypothetical protein